MYLPDWIQKYKEPRCEIRFIKGTYYKYEVCYQYNKEKKRTDKKTVRLLGKITPENGFIASDKDKIRRQSESLPKVDIKTYGIFHLFERLLLQERATLPVAFGEEHTQRLLSFALMRWAYQSPIKRAGHYHAHDYCSEQWSKESLNDKNISGTLRYIGQNRQAAVRWMRSLLEGVEANSYVMMDSTHIPSLSDNLAINAKGYNPSFHVDRQLRLMYLFSAKLKQPVYYRLIGGNITDISSMSRCVKEMNVKEVVFIADKGFYSQDNIRMLDEEKLQYIIPLRRNNTLIDFSRLQDANYKKEIHHYFSYQKRIIWYYTYEKDGMKLVTFLDEHLRVSEENDYWQRTKTQPEKYSEANFYEKLHQFGTLTMVYKINRAIQANEIYETYKQRNEIEVMFDSYKNYLEADATYMQDRHVLEGWLFANFVAMIAYYRLFVRIKEAELLKNYAPKDMIELAKSIYMMKIKEKWKLSELTQKIQNLFRKIKIDYLTELS
jgi:hypothetical protein